MSTIVTRVMGQELLGEDLMGGYLFDGVELLGTPTEGQLPLSVLFKYVGDDDEDDFAGYLWTFGDGITSSERQPVHVYTMVGSYTVSLTVELDDGTKEQVVESDYINVDYCSDAEYEAVISRPNVSYRYGQSSREGIGFSENTGDAWVRPEARTGTLRVIDNRYLQRTVVFDYKSGLFYDMTNRTAGETDGVDLIWTDKADSNGENGTEIEQTVWFKADTGTYKHYYLENNESHIYLSSINNDAEYPDGLELDYYTYSDGNKTNEKASLQDITKTSGDLIFDKKCTGQRIQQRLVANRANLQITGRQTYYKVSDRPSRGSTALNSENTWSTSIASDMTAWISRSLDFKDRVTGDTYTPTYTNIDGADTLTDSGQQTTTSFILGNIASGRIQLWTNDPTTFITDFETANSITMIDSEITSNGFTFLYYEGVVAANVVIPISGIFDLRVYSTTLDDGAVSYYTDDIVKFKGINTCPLYI